jgi:hypothetical protein
MMIASRPALIVPTPGRQLQFEIRPNDGVDVKKNQRIISHKKDRSFLLLEVEFVVRDTTRYPQFPSWRKEL